MPLEASGLFCATWSSGLFPCPCFTVTGSFLAGLLYVLIKQRFPAFEPYAPIFLIGFLGAFTTFSTLALESANMLLAGEYGRAALNLLIQNVSGVAAVFCGICAGRLI